PLRASAVERHGVDLGRSFILGGEGNGLSVRRDGGVALFARVAGQTRGDPTVDRDLPEVTLRDENEGVLVEGRLAVVPGGRGGGCEGTEGEEEEGGKGQGTEDAHGGSRGQRCRGRDEYHDGGDAKGVQVRPRKNASRCFFLASRPLLPLLHWFF